MATYRAPATSNTSRTRAVAADGASALAMARRSPQRGTVPYSAKQIASSTVDLPEPVGPTRAKKSVSVKSTTTGSRKTVKPCRSSRNGRI